MAVSKNLIISFLVVSFASTVAPGANFDSSKSIKPLMDGFALTGVDGRLISTDSNQNGWFFVSDSNISDDRGLIKAGSAIELLPSMALERMIADVNKHSAASYRLWDVVTQYRGRNFIFPEYFLPLSKIQQKPSQTSQQSQQTPDRPTINEPNDALTIPKEIIAKLETRKIMPVEQPIEQPGTRIKLTQDFILADRTAVVVQQTDGCGLLTLDAVGRGVQQISLRLLPCQALELAQRQQSVEPEQLRFKIAGRVTEYKGQYYLLLQRAIRVYSHGNF